MKRTSRHAMTPSDVLMSRSPGEQQLRTKTLSRSTVQRTSLTFIEASIICTLLLQIFSSLAEIRDDVSEQEERLRMRRAVPVTATTSTPTTTTTTSSPEPSEEPSLNPSITADNICGLPKIPPNVFERIVGGTYATPNSYPWQVGLLFYGKPYCGGSIIANTWVLTAAHCIYGLDARFFTVTVGCNTRLPSSECLVFHVDVTIPHPAYTSQSTSNDIALVHLTKLIQFNAIAIPVCLPTIDPDINDQCVATGWGATYNTSYSDNLEQVILPIVSLETCNQIYDNAILDTMLCAGYPGGGMDTCQGDSGGPLLDLVGNRWFVSGVTSAGVGCGLPNKPGIYTSVAMFYAWIVQEVNSTKECGTSLNDCSQTCIDTFGGFTCSCLQGFILQNGTNCVPAVPPCGVPTVQQLIDLTVSGQTDAPENAYPWLVSIAYWPALSTHRCSGTIINANWIVTSATCLLNLKTGTSLTPAHLAVTAGEYFLNTPTSQSQVVYAARTIIHELYNSTTVVNNIALILLSSPLHISAPSIQALCLPPLTLTSSAELSSVCITTGWNVNTGSSVPVTQQYKRLINVQNYNDLMQQPFLAQNKVLAITYDAMTWQPVSPTAYKLLPPGTLPVEEGVISSCGEDTGGPLACYVNDALTLVGVMTSECLDGVADVVYLYTDVTSYVSWLSSKINATATVVNLTPGK